MCGSSVADRRTLAGPFADLKSRAAVARARWGVRATWLEAGKAFRWHLGAAKPDPLKCFGMGFEVMRLAVMQCVLLHPFGWQDGPPCRKAHNGEARAHTATPGPEEVEMFLTIVLVAAAALQVSAHFCAWRAVTSARTPQGAVGWVVFLLSAPQCRSADVPVSRASPVPRLHGGAADEPGRHGGCRANGRSESAVRLPAAGQRCSSPRRPLGLSAAATISIPIVTGPFDAQISHPSRHRSKLLALPGG